MLRAFKKREFPSGQGSCSRGRCLLFGVVLSAAMNSACSREEVKKEPVVNVQTAVTQKTAVKEVIHAEATLFPLHQASITPKISAPVKQFYVGRGSTVREGQLLAVLENGDLIALQVESKGTYDQAQAEYQAATSATIPEEMHKAELEAQAARQMYEAEQKVYDNRQNLYKQGALPRKELDQAGVALTQARNQFEISQRHLDALKAVANQQHIRAAAAQLESAKGKYMGANAMLEYSQIRSPIDGVVTERPLYPGEMAAAGSPLLTVMDLSKVVARAHIPQQQAAQLKVGDPATVSAPGLDEEVLAKMTVVSPATDPNSTTVEVWAEASNRERKLRPGTTVHLAIVARTIPDTIVVPANSVLISQEGSSVMVVGADGRAHQHAVELGVRQENEVQITKGLKAGDRVVTVGAYGLPDNSKIQDVTEAPKANKAASDSRGPR